MPELNNNNFRTVCFFGACAALSSKVLVSQRISSPFIVSEIRASFALNTNRTLKLSFFVSPDPSAPVTGTPTGFDCLDEYGQVSFLTGDDEQKTVKNNSLIKEHPSWLKIFALNADNFEHTIDAQIDIQLVSRE